MAKDMFQVAAVWLEEIRSSHLVTTVTYQRGPDSIFDLPATIAATSYEITTEEGFTVRARATAFLIKAALIVINGVLTEPQIGDEILLTEGTPSVNRIFRVLDLGGAGHFKPADRLGVVTRIYTKLVSEI